MSREILDRNLMALSARSPDAAMRIQAASPSDAVEVMTARNGLKVPRYGRGSEGKPCHSTVDPERDAEKIAAWRTDAEYFAILGIGGGYVARALLKRPSTTGVMAFDRDPGALKAIMWEIDMTDVFAHSAFRLHLDLDPGETQGAFLEDYVPALRGNFASLPLVARTDLDREYFLGIERSLERALRRVSEDFSVQSFFGAAWFRNIVRNLLASERAWTSLPPARKVIVTAAGPSLEAGLGKIATRGQDTFLLATDTSLPALLKSDIVPDGVISIDCQHISYNHFMEGYPESVPLFLDLASPPLLASFSEHPVFLASGHPLCLYAAGKFRDFPAVDTSGGNVTHAAVSLASRLGASEVRVYGADFSYPGGKSYARGTYLYSYFGTRSSRRKPNEAHFVDFLFRNTELKKEADDHGTRFVTKPLESYLRSFESLCQGLPCRVEHVRGGGVPVNTGGGDADERTEPGIMHGGKRTMKAAEFLSRYARELEALPVGPGFTRADIETLDNAARDVLTTLLPAVASIRKREGASGHAAISLARDFQVGFLRAMGL